MGAKKEWSRVNYANNELVGGPNHARTRAAARTNGRGEEVMNQKRARLLSKVIRVRCKSNVRAGEVK